MHRLRTFRKGKAAKPEPVRPQIDLATVLPSDKDLRVSVLMPQLSARFSMLREQDDPHTKIGKASDDSVLFNHRCSRAGLGFGGALGDISEVASINGSIRPPFATESRPESSQGYATDDDNSVMSRSRPSESNIMFGGRQKIYKISGSTSRPELSTSTSTGALSTSSASSRTMGGKHVYDSDINFPTYRQRAQLALDERDSDEHERQYSPTLAGYNQNRETSSTTSSIPLRSSTAATSINSQPPETPNAPLPTMVISPQFVRPPSRTRRPLYEQGLDQQLSERKNVNRIENLSRQGNYAPVSEEPRKENGFGDFNFGTDSPSRHGPTPPLSPPLDEVEEDVSKQGIAATLNVFARQKRHYDEAQYTQRQMQLQRGRETPELVKTDFSHPVRQSPPRVLGPPAARSVSDSAQRQLATPRHNLPLTPVDSPHESDVHMDLSSRNSASTDNVRSSASSIPQEQSEPFVSEPVKLSLPQPDSPLVQVSHADTPDVVEPAVETTSPFQRNPIGFGKAPHLTLQQEDNSGDGFSNMVRTHLRNNSNHSSVYSATSPALHSYVIPSPMTASHPYKLHDASLDTRLDFDDWDGGYYSQPNHGDPVPEIPAEHHPGPVAETVTSSVAHEYEAARESSEQWKPSYEPVQNLQSFEFEPETTPPRGTSAERTAIWNSPIPEDRVQDIVSERRQAPGLLAESPSRGVGVAVSQPEPWAADKDKMMYSAQNSQSYGQRTRQSGNSFRSEAQESGRYSEDTQRRAPKSSTRSSNTSGRDRSDSDLSANSRGDRYRDDLARAMATGIGRDSYAEMRSEPKSYEPSPLIEQDSLPPLLENNVLQERSQSRSQSRSRSRSNSRAGENYKAKTMLGLDALNLPARHAAHTPAYSTNHTPSLAGPRKRSIKKSDISDPVFVSSTASSITVVDLPHNGGPTPPPLPMLNPRRKQRDDGTRSSGEEDPMQQDFSPQLRKATSEGTSLRSRAWPVPAPSSQIPLPAPDAQGSMF